MLCHKAFDEIYRSMYEVVESFLYRRISKYSYYTSSIKEYIYHCTLELAICIFIGPRERYNKYFNRSCCFYQNVRIYIASLLTLILV